MAVYLYLELSIFMFFMLFVCVCQTFNKEFTYLLTHLIIRKTITHCYLSMLIFIKQKIVKRIWSDKGYAVSGVNRVQSADCGKHPCGVCSWSILIQSCVYNGSGGFMKDVVASQEIKNLCWFPLQEMFIEEGPVELVSLREVEIEPNVKLECVPKFCYLSDILDVGGGVEEATRARVWCAWAKKFKELSPILTAEPVDLVHHITF